MLGIHPSWTPNPAEAVAPRLSGSIDVSLVSSKKNPYWRLLDTVFHLLRSRRSLDCAVILVYSGRSFRIAEVSSRVARAVGLPTVLWLHGGGLPALAKASPRRVKRLLKGSSTCVAPSRYLQRRLSHLGVPIKVIPNLLDLPITRFQPRPTVQPKILWLRKFEDIYQPLAAVEIFHNIRTSHPGAQMTMAGQDRGLQEKTLGHAKELGCQDEINFPGFLSGSDKAAAFATHDIFLHTNTVDNAPVALVEAAAHGLPIVAADVGGIADLFEDDVSALLFPPQSTDVATAAILRLLAEPDLAVRLAIQDEVLIKNTGPVGLGPDAVGELDGVPEILQHGNAPESLLGMRLRDVLLESAGSG